MRCIWNWPVLVLVTLFASGVHAQPKAWEQLGPEGGRIVSIAQHPTDVQVMLAVPYGYPSQLFKSTNRGSTWSRLSSVSDYVHTVRFDPLVPATVYACANYSFHKSTNSGLSWTRYTFPSNYYSYDLAIDPVNPANLHASCDAYDGSKWVPAYAKSTNGGATWTGQMLGTDAGACMGITLDGVSPTTVYLGGYQYVGSAYSTRFYRSTDGGVTFVERSGTMTGVYIYDVQADPVTGGKVFAASAAGVYRSTNRGETWTANSGYVPVAYRFAISRANPSLLLAATTAGIPYKSTDGGVNWTSAGTGVTGSGYEAIHIESGASPYAFLGNNAGVFRTTNSGTSWQSCCTGLNSASITALRNAPSAQSTLFAAFLNNAVYKTTTASSATVNWQRMPDFYSCVSVEDFAISAANPDRLYAMEGGT
jgi:photosystem II stability/assembly factor-like uncharacterized protein